MFILRSFVNQAPDSADIVNFVNYFTYLPTYLPIRTYLRTYLLTCLLIYSLTHYEAYSTLL